MCMFWKRDRENDMSIAIILVDRLAPTCFQSCVLARESPMEKLRYESHTAGPSTYLIETSNINYLKTPPIDQNTYHNVEAHIVCSYIALLQYCYLIYSDGS